jgi:hypothetical protein
VTFRQTSIPSVISLEKKSSLIAMSDQVPQPFEFILQPSLVSVKLFLYHHPDVDDLFLKPKSVFSISVADKT